MRLKVLALLAVILPNLGQAEYKNYVEVEMAGQVVEVMTPPWSYAGFHHLHTEEFYASAKTSSGGEFHLTEFIPKGESFGEQGEFYGGWTRLYAIALETDVQQSAEEIMAGQLAIYYSACEEMDWQRSNTTDASEEILLIYCAAFKDNPEVGEISFFYLKVDNQQMLKNYYHIRTPRIDLANFPTGQAGDAATQALDDIVKMMLQFRRPVLR